MFHNKTAQEGICDVTFQFHDNNKYESKKSFIFWSAEFALQQGPDRTSKDAHWLESWMVGLSVHDGASRRMFNDK